MTREQIEKIAEAVMLFEQLPENERWRLIGRMEEINTRAEYERVYTENKPNVSSTHAVRL